MSMKPEAQAQIRRFFDGTLLPDEMIEAMTSDCGWFPSRTITPGSRASFFENAWLSLENLRVEDHGRSFDLYDYLSVNRVAGLMVLKDGRRDLETYSLRIDRSEARRVGNVCVGTGKT